MPSVVGTTPLQCAKPSQARADPAGSQGKPGCQSGGLHPAHSLIPSKSGKGHCNATAMGEIGFNTIKAASIWRTALQRRDGAINASGAESGGFCHPVRRHAALGYQAPIAFGVMRHQSTAAALHSLRASPVHNATDRGAAATWSVVLSIAATHVTGRLTSNLRQRQSLR